eukprot:SAG31_NODE_2282_length_6017_cov_16.322237_7_plen_51_part_00
MRDSCSLLNLARSRLLASKRQRRLTVTIVQILGLLRHPVIVFSLLGYMYM